jgi:hypothetical protein
MSRWVKEQPLSLCCRQGTTRHKLKSFMFIQWTLSSEPQLLCKVDSLYQDESCVNTDASYLSRHVTLCHSYKPLAAFKISFAFGRFLFHTFSWHSLITCNRRNMIYSSLYRVVSERGCYFRGSGLQNLSSNMDFPSLALQFCRSNHWTYSGYCMFTPSVTLKMMQFAHRKYLWAVYDWINGYHLCKQN